jgi:hypothetical protein
VVYASLYILFFFEGPTESICDDVAGRSKAPARRNRMNTERVRSGPVGKSQPKLAANSNLNRDLVLLVVGFSRRRLLAVDRHALLPRWQTSKSGVAVVSGTAVSEDVAIQFQSSPSQVNFQLILRKKVSSPAEHILTAHGRVQVTLGLFKSTIPAS